jgi:hypothetical protein
MKRFLRLNRTEKQYIKMINQSERGFELAISENYFQKLMNFINKCEEKNYDISIVWQMKFKPENYILYRNCIFLEPHDNNKNYQTFGKKIKVKCSRIDFFTKSYIHKGTVVKKCPKHKYNDYLLLDRVLKISELDELNEI